MSDTNTYKLVGSKGNGERVDRVVIEGSASDPKVFVDLGGTVELTAEEAKQVSSDFGVKLTKQKSDGTDDESDSHEGVTTRAEQQVSQAPAVSLAVPSNPAGSDPAGGKPKEVKN